MISTSLNINVFTYNINPKALILIVHLFELSIRESFYRRDDFTPLNQKKGGVPIGHPLLF